MATPERDNWLCTDGVRQKTGELIWSLSKLQPKLEDIRISLYVALPCLSHSLTSVEQAALLITDYLKSAVLYARSQVEEGRGESRRSTSTKSSAGKFLRCQDHHTIVRDLSPSLPNRKRQHLQDLPLSPCTFIVQPPMIPITDPRLDKGGVAKSIACQEHTTTAGQQIT